jgi:hypothetical protein
MVKNVYREQMCLNGTKGSKKGESHFKTMNGKFIFYAKDTIHHEFLPEKQTVNGKFYKEAIKRLLARVHHVRPEFQESGSWYHLHDNALVHSSGVVSEFLAKRGIPVLSQPPYLSVLAPADFVFLCKLKIAMKGTRFETVPTD